MSAVEAIPARLTEAEHQRLLADAIAREAIGGRWRVQHLMAVLDLSRASVYRTPWLMRLKKRRGARGVQWIPAEVRAAQERASAAPIRRARRAD